MTDETRTVARFVAQFKHEQMPRRVRDRAVDLIVDQIGVELGCCELPWAKQVRETFSQPGGLPEATVVKYGDRVPVAAAAFINGTFGHSFEYDDGNPRFHGHPGGELMPSLFAISERGHIPGRDFFEAFVASYEIRGRIGWALSPHIVQHGGPQYSTTCGPYGAAAGVAKLLGMDAEGIRNAIAIAGAYSGGLMQYDHGGGSVKRIYTAVAASSGIQAAHLAKSGMTGPEGILEGDRGVLRIYSSEYHPERLVEGLGSDWMFDTIYFKPYCVVGIIASAIDGFRKILTDYNLKADDVEGIEVGYPKGFHEHAAIAAPHDLLGMQFSTPYSLALTALKGSNTPRDYTMEALADPAMRAFAAKVKVYEDTELTRMHEGRLPGRTTVRTRAGQVYEEKVVSARGSPGAPFTSADIDAKFRSQVVHVLGEERCEKLLRVLRNIDTLDDMAKLAPMLVA